MPFEALAERWEVFLPDFPMEWIPLTYLYDPDLPLFPILYFHALDPDLPPGNRPSFKDRVFGYIHHLNLEEDGARATVILNKNLNATINEKYKPVVEQQVRNRLGLGDPINSSDIATGLKGSLAGSNNVMIELWHKVVAPAFGNKLPYGRLWDPVLGLVRFIASFNSPDGRKGEFIQTHYFATDFGERIGVGSGVNVDFYLLPTFEEFQDTTNPLALFPKFSALVDAAARVVSLCCSEVDIDGQKFSFFSRTAAFGCSKLDKTTLHAFIAAQPASYRRALYDNLSAFDRGPPRAILSLLMIHDLRVGNWSPSGLTPDVCAKMYTGLEGSHQSPKVKQLYAQQCFGALPVLPIDIWIKTFLQWPLQGGVGGTAAFFTSVFSASDVWGKLERLIWVASQSRKVHSSVAAEILWCIRYGGPNKIMRGANPLSCKLCDSVIRSVCPSFAAIRNLPVTFNDAAPPSTGFNITTSAGDNTSPNQTFNLVVGLGNHDEYSAGDRPASFRPYPQPGAVASTFNVDDFLSTY